MGNPEKFGLDHIRCVNEVHVSAVHYSVWRLSTRTNICFNAELSFELIQQAIQQI